MTMSYIWAAIALVSLIFAVVGGKTAELSAAALDGAATAVKLAVAMTGALCLWNGVVRVMEKSGISAMLARLLLPVVGRLIPEAKGDEALRQSVSGCVTANLLGLGNAATPLGIESVLRMKKLSGQSETATDSMCSLIVLSTASIQLIPSTVAALRSAAGAASPFDILPAVWLTSVCSVAVGLLAAKVLAKWD